MTSFFFFKDIDVALKEIESKSDIVAEENYSDNDPIFSNINIMASAVSTVSSIYR